MILWPLAVAAALAAAAPYGNGRGTAEPTSSFRGGPEPSTAAVRAAIETIEGFDNFLVLKKDYYDPREIELGRDLFFDKKLSHGGAFSCSSCHQPERAYSDGRPRAIGRDGKPLLRNAPSLKITGIDPHYQVGLFRDGRAKSVEDVVKSVFHEPMEFGTTPEEVASFLSRDKGYAPRLAGLYGQESASEGNAAKALSAFINSLPPRKPSPYDRALDEPQALSAAQKRGLILFAGKARCVRCHYSPDLAGSEIVNTGLKPQAGVEDDGRYRVTGAARDRRAFKIPSLRDVAVTAPYMHDGSLATLADVVEFYDRGGDAHDGQDVRIRPLNLSVREKKDLEAFLFSLTSPPDDGEPAYAAPRPPAETASAPAEPSPSLYWELSPEIAYRLERARRRVETLESMRRPWTARADYSGAACVKNATPDRLAKDDGDGVFTAGERDYLNRNVFWDLNRFYWARAMAEQDGTLCAKLGYQGSRFRAESGYYQCRNWYLEMGFIQNMVAQPPDFMRRCEQATSIDADALRYKPLCPTIHENIEDIGAMCEKLYDPFLLVTAKRSCRVLFSAINGEPLDCAHYFRSPTGYDRCEAYGAYLRAFRAGDAARCGGLETCEVMMGRGEEVAARIAARIKAKLCAADPARTDYIKTEQAEAGAALDQAQALLDRVWLARPGEQPAPPEAAQRLAEVASLRGRLASGRPSFSDAR